MLKQINKNKKPDFSWDCVWCDNWWYDAIRK